MYILIKDQLNLHEKHTPLRTCNKVNRLARNLKQIFGDAHKYCQNIIRYLITII